MAKKHRRIQFYWSRKDEAEIESIIEAEIPKKSIIWDPFMGSGSTYFAVNKTGNKFVGTELNEMPFQSLLFNIIKPSKRQLFDSEKILRNIKKAYSDLYRFEINEKECTLKRIVFSNQEYTKIAEVKLVDIEGKIYSKKDLNNKTLDQIIERYSFYSKALDRSSLPTLEENSRIAIKEGMKICDIFSPITFHLLTNIKSEVVQDNILRNVLASILHLCRLTDKKSQSQFPYWIPKKDVVDRNILILLEEQFYKYKKYLETIESPKVAGNFTQLSETDALFLNLPAQNIDNEIPDNTIDYIITDPPYYDQIPYSEYLKIWEFFLDYKSNLQDEIVVSNNKNNGKSKEQYLKQMKVTFEIIAKKLKNDGKIFMYFKDSSIDKVKEIRELIEETGLCYTESVHLQNSIYTYKQNTTQKTSITGNNLLIFTKSKLKKDSKVSKTKQKSINKKFLQELLESFIYTNKEVKLAEIQNFITEAQRQYQVLEEFKSSKELSKWVDSFAKYNEAKRTYRFASNNQPLENHLMLGNSLDILTSIPDKSIDCCITDPPYNIKGKRAKEIGWYNSNSLWKEKKGFKKINEEWDNFSEDSYESFTIKWLEEIKRVVKENGNIAIFGSYHNIFKIGYLLEMLDFRVINSIVWYKRNAFPNITQRMFCESTEYIIWAVNNSVKKAKNWTFNYKTMKEINGGKQMRNMWDIPSTPTRERAYGKHPSQKPLEVLNNLILALTTEKDLILDPFLGSGTTALSAVNNNRKYIGIDSSLEYLMIADSRIQKRTLPLDLK